MITTSSTINFDYVNNVVLQALDNREQQLRASIEKTASDSSPGTLLAMQQQVQMWSMLITIQGTIVKEISDAMKGVIQKAS